MVLLFSLISDNIKVDIIIIRKLVSGILTSKTLVLNDCLATLANLMGLRRVGFELGTYEPKE